MIKNEFRHDIGTPLAERTALLAAVAWTGRTFDRGLRDRKLAGQMIATGLTGSIGYGLLVTTQTLLWAGASHLAPWPLPAEPGFHEQEAVATHPWKVRTLAYGTYLLTYGAAEPIKRALAAREDESDTRAFLRSAAQGMRSSSSMGLLATVSSDALYVTLRRAQAGARAQRIAGHALMLAMGASTAMALIHQSRRREAQATGRPAPSLHPQTVAAGIGTAAGLTLLARAETMAARMIGRWTPACVPHSVGTAAGHTALLTGLAAGIMGAIRVVYRRTEKAGSVLEPFGASAPESRHVSGGPASILQWDDLTREGRRFAGLSLSSTEIREVMGSVKATPCRVFIPVDAAGDPEERARLALAEMESLGAFDRSLIVLCSPTGTGYVNYVMAEAVEYLTTGDCAIVAAQYSLRPSFLSLDRVRLGRHNARALFTAVHDHVAGLPPDRRPRVVQFGESLGAHTGQDVMLHAGAAAFGTFSIERALFIGTPEESKWAKEWRADPGSADPEGIVVEVGSIEEYHCLPVDQRRRARIVLVSHGSDPITKFGPELLVRRPAWLDRDPGRRPLGVPAEMRWYPLSTFFMIAADVINAMSVVPGRFEAEGHDYRADLARFVSATYMLPVSQTQLQRIERALRRRELLIAESRLVAAEISAAQHRAEQVIDAWGADAEPTDAHLAAEISRAYPIEESDSE